MKPRRYIIERAGHRIGSIMASNQKSALNAFRQCIPLDLAQGLRARKALEGERP